MSPVKVVGIKSGNVASEIHHVAHALHRGDKLAKDSVKFVRITEDENTRRPTVRTVGPLTALAWLGFAMSVSLVALSVKYNDGMALLATILLSFLGLLTGIANKWTPTPNAPKHDPFCPPGDVVIRYPQGAFIVVLCEEVTARYLYFNPSERCQYLIRSSPVYRLLSLLGTLLLMGGVICLANATIELQTGFAASYMLLNIFYWIVAALPPARHWDLSRLTIENIKVDGGFADIKDRADHSKPSNYTEALWKAIAITGCTDWVKEAELAPKTASWEEWLQEAKHAAEAEKIDKYFRDKPRTLKRVETWKIPSWDPKARLSELLKPESARIDV